MSAYSEQGMVRVKIKSKKNNLRRSFAAFFSHSYSADFALLGYCHIRNRTETRHPAFCQY